MDWFLWEERKGVCSSVGLGPLLRGDGGAEVLRSLEDGEKRAFHRCQSDIGTVADS